MDYHDLNSTTATTINIGGGSHLESGTEFPGSACGVFLDLLPVNSSGDRRGSL